MLLVVVASSLACSSSFTEPGPDSGGTGASGVDGTKLVTSTTADERKMLCDWSATLYGGYGKSRSGTCDGGTVTSPGPTSQGDCVGGLGGVPAGCPATVKQTEDCLTAQSKTAPCDFLQLPPECAVYDDPRCRRVSDAGTDAPPDTASTD